MKKVVKMSARSKHSLIIAICVLVLVFILLLGIQFYLYYNFLLGNDVAVRINVDREFLDLTKGESAEVKVSAKVFTNPFCETKCNYSFHNLANGENIDSGLYDLKNSEPFSKTYSLKSPITGAGEIFYRFEIHCSSIENFLCYTGTEPFYQNSLVVMRYKDSPENLILKNISRIRLTQLLDNSSYWSDYFQDLNIALQDSNVTISGVGNKIMSAKDFQKEVLGIADIWEREDYIEANRLLEERMQIYNSLNQDFREFKIDSDLAVLEYNALVEKMNSAQLQFMQLVRLSYSDFSLDEAKSMSNNLINARDEFFQMGTMEDKKNYWAVVRESIDRLNGLVEDDNLNGYVRNKSLGIVFAYRNISSLELEEGYNKLFLKEPKEICCLFGDCKECCNGCSSNETLYPVIFLHGHDFSADVSAELNLNIFDNIQRELEKEGYLNAGTMMVNVPEEIPEGIWKRSLLPISVKMSYYFDSVKEEGKLNILQTKKDNIDTYSIRLKNIIESVEKKTGKDKVILVTHSMGGLVARRYVQIFGEEDIHKIIMIAAPNKGITEGIYGYCVTFGEREACDDMNQGSLFLAKIEGQKFMSADAFNIIGIGCETDGLDGDGVVQKQNGFMENAENYYVSGNCSSFTYLHSELLKPDKYPETYELVKKILKN